MATSTRKVTDEAEVETVGEGIGDEVGGWWGGWWEAGSAETSNTRATPSPTTTPMYPSP